MATTEEFLAKLEDQLSNLEEITADGIIMLYGDSGVGKSVASLALAQKITPPGKTILFIDSGAGWVSINNHPQLKTRVKRAQFKNVEQVEAFAMAIAQNLGDWGNVGCIILDEASAMAKQDLDELVRGRARTDASKDPNEAKWPDMGASNNRLIHMYNALVKLGGVHVISTAHVRMEKDDTGFERQSPDFMPSLGKTVRQLMHLVAHMSETTVGEGDDAKQVRTYQVHPSKRIVAKSRVGGLAPKITFQTLADGLAKWLDTGGKGIEEVPLVFDDINQSGTEQTERSSE